MALCSQAGNVLLASTKLKHLTVSIEHVSTAPQSSGLYTTLFHTLHTCYIRHFIFFMCESVTTLCICISICMKQKKCNKEPKKKTTINNILAKKWFNKLYNLQHITWLRRYRRGYSRRG